MVLPGLALLPFGIGFGVAAAQKGLSAFETTLMSLTVMAGTSQMVALDLWAQPLPLVALAVSVFVANLRYFVMGAALQPSLPHLPWYLQPPVWYVTFDQNWAVNIAEYRRGHGDLGKFFGGGFVMAWIWSGSTLLGHLAAGGLLADPTTAPPGIGLRGRRGVRRRGHDHVSRQARHRPLDGGYRRRPCREVVDPGQLVHRDRRPDRRPLRRVARHAETECPPLLKTF
jgi:hypothetical protein